MKKKWYEPEPGGTRFKKILLAMRLTLFLLIFAVFSSNAASYGQSTLLNMSLKNMEIREVLGQIEDQSEYSFMYDNNQIDVSRKVSVDVKSSSVQDILADIFRGTNVSYKIINRHIMLNRAGSPITMLAPGEQFVLQGERGMVKKLSNTSKVVSWKDNLLQFENQPVDEVLDCLGRWYGVDFHVDSEILNNHRYTFNVKTESLREVLELISVITPIEYSIDGEEVHIKYK